MTKVEARQSIIANMLEVMRDCSDPTYRTAAYDVLVSVLPVELKPKRWGAWERHYCMPGYWEN